MLEKYNIDFKKEEFYKKYIKDFKKNYRFDFTLSIDDRKYFVEIFGITGFEEYNKKTIKKINLCKINNLLLIDLHEKDIKYKTIEDIYNLVLNRIISLNQESLRSDYNKCIIK